MKKTAKILSILLVACLTLAILAGCGDAFNETATEAATKAANTSAEETAAETGETVETAEDTTEAAVTAEETTEETAEETTEEATAEETEPEPEGDVLKIGTREELFAFAESVLNGEAEYEEMTILLTADIDLDPSLDGGKHWTPITTDGLDDATIDGGGHIINGMTVAPDDVVTVADGGYGYGSGFIGVSTSSIAIKNIIFSNAKIDADTKHCGCVIGSVEGGPAALVEIDNVKVSNLTLDGGIGVEGNIDGISFRVGGIAGANITGAQLEITNCTVEDSRLFGFHNLGGILGCSNELMYTLENNTVKNVSLNYSAGYATNERYHVEEDIRYFADPFYNVNNYWGEYHTDIDKEAGNTYENLDSYDIKFDKHYKDEEGKDADNKGVEQDDGLYFPAIFDKGTSKYTSPIRPKGDR